MDLDLAIKEASQSRWDESRAWSWYRNLPWLVGCNFVPSCAVNQLEMWQEDTFSPEIIDRELALLAGIGMNTVRVFLHDLAWKQAPEGFVSRLEKFLTIASRHGIGVMVVFFDSCWHPFPRAGKQRDPEPGVHNSFWLQSPGLWLLREPASFDQLQDYVTTVVHRFRDDPRIHAWDVWNEPDNNNANCYGPRDFPGDEKGNVVLPLLAKAFAWVREAQPTQPVTAGIWNGDWSAHDKLADWARFQVEASDVISFHRYASLAETQRDAQYLERYGRPLLCTEYMARGAGSTFEAILPYFKQARIAAYNWGGIAGRSQTQHAWNTWQMPATSEPTPWFHDIFRADGTPYDPKEVKLIRELTRDNSSLDK
jgi:hypothetical protein